MTQRQVSGSWGRLNIGPREAVRERAVVITYVEDVVRVTAGRSFIRMGTGLQVLQGAHVVVVIESSGGHNASSESIIGSSTTNLLDKNMAAAAPPLVSYGTNMRCRLLRSPAGPCQRRRTPRSWMIT